MRRRLCSRIISFGSNCCSLLFYSISICSIWKVTSLYVNPINYFWLFSFIWIWINYRSYLHIWSFCGWRRVVIIWIGAIGCCIGSLRWLIVCSIVIIVRTQWRWYDSFICVTITQIIISIFCLIFLSCINFIIRTICIRTVCLIITRWCIPDLMGYIFVRPTVVINCSSIVLITIW